MAESIAQGIRRVRRVHVARTLPMSCASAKTRAAVRYLEEPPGVASTRGEDNLAGHYAECSPNTSHALAADAHRPARNPPLEPACGHHMAIERGAQTATDVMTALAKYAPAKVGGDGASDR